MVTLKHWSMHRARRSSSVVASRWQVDSKALQFMKTFYTGYSKKHCRSRSAICTVGTQEQAGSEHRTTGASLVFLGGNKTFQEEGTHQCTK